ncbi:MAG: sodium-dependent transporter [Brachymonas sp.]
MANATTQRDGFSSGFGVLAATLGSAVGLGNIWRFPYETGSSGGAGFLLVYILATLLVGLPVMIAEISLGRTAQTDPLGVYLRLAPRSPWWIIGAMGLASVGLIIAFYSGVVGWVFAYIAKSLGSSLLTQDRQALEGAFTGLITDPAAALAWQWAVLLLMGVILSFGVSKGIEAVTKKLMPILFLLLCVIAATSLSMPAAMEGVKFLFVPDFGKIDGAVILKALGLAFFKLSLGVGSMTIYGSYFRKEQNIPKTALTVMLADLAVSLLAGLAIFPAVFSLGFNPAGGPALLFNTIPAVFAQMPMGHALMVLFFILTAFAAIGALLSLIEVPIAVLHERLGWSRPLATWAAIACMVALGALCALSFSTLGGVTLIGKNNIFDSFDFASSKILMPLAGLLTSLFVSLHWGKKAFVKANSNHGTLGNERLLGVVFWVLATVSPILIGVIMYFGLTT